MLREIIVADIHVQIKKDVPISWQEHRYRMLFDNLISLCLEYNANLIITGDLFERARPQLLEILLVMEFFRRCKKRNIRVALCSGNHETIAPGIDTFQYLDMGTDKTIEVEYDRDLEICHKQEGVVYYFLNHCDLQNPPDFAEFVNPEMCNILFAHFRCNINEYIREEVNVRELIAPFDICIAGDIHAPYEDGKLVYASQPLNDEFQRTPNCGVIYLEIEDKVPKIRRLKTDFPNLIQVTCKVSEYPPKLDDFNFYRVEVSGEMSDLKEIKATTDNMKLVKLPYIDDVYIETQQEEELQEIPLDLELIQYMNELGMPEEKIRKMIDIFKEAA